MVLKGVLKTVERFGKRGETPGKQRLEYLVSVPMVPAIAAPLVASATPSTSSASPASPGGPAAGTAAAAACIAASDEDLQQALARATLALAASVVARARTALDASPAALPAADESGAHPARPTLAEAVARLEMALLDEALQVSRGNRAKAARLLGTTERILSYKVGKYGIDCGRYRR